MISEEDLVQECYHTPVFDPESSSNTEYEDDFALDSGAGRHMTKQKEYLSKFRKLHTPLRLRVPDDRILLATHVGQMKIKVVSRHNIEREMILEEVYYVPNFHINLLSEDRLTCEDKFQILFTSQYADVINVESGEVWFSAAKQNSIKWVPMIIKGTGFENSLSCTDNPSPLSKNSSLCSHISPVLCESPSQSSAPAIVTQINALDARKFCEFVFGADSDAIVAATNVVQPPTKIDEIAISVAS